MKSINVMSSDTTQLPVEDNQTDLVDEELDIEPQEPDGLHLIDACISLSHFYNTYNESDDSRES
jgi:hypothetical protein